MDKDAEECNECSDLREELKKFRKEMLAEFQDLKKSVEFCTESCDDISQTKVNVKELIKEVKALRDANHVIKEENRKLAQRVDELEQYSRINNLEIKGVPNDGDALTLS